jgi:hypothetical protein
MRTGAESQVATIELVDALECNGTGFLTAKSLGDLLPCLTLPPLLPDEFNVHFKSAVKRRSAAGFHRSCLRRIAYGF